MEPRVLEVTAKAKYRTFGGRLSAERLKYMVELALENEMLDDIEVVVREGASGVKAVEN